MKKTIRHIPAPLIEAAIVLLCALLLWQCVGVSADLRTSGGCFSVTFDKAAVKQADRVVVYSGGREITITDKAAVKQIAGYFIVANRTDLCNERAPLRMDIYKGNRLIRSIQEVCAGYQIYDTGFLHWIFPSSSKMGQVELSREEHAALDALIEQYTQ